MGGAFHRLGKGCCFGEFTVVTNSPIEVGMDKSMPKYYEGVGILLG